MPTTDKLEDTSDSIENLLIALNRAYLPLAISETFSSLGKQSILFPNLKEITLHELNKVRYREKKDIRYSMASFFAALHGTNKPLAFILTGNKKETSIYFGVWENSEIQENISDNLEGAIKGFIPGTEFKKATNSKSIIDSLEKFTSFHSIVGVPSEKQVFQDEKRTGAVEFGIERLADAMTSDEYALLIIASPIEHKETAKYFENLSSILDYTHRLVKISDQISSSQQYGSNIGLNGSITKTTQEGTQESESISSSQSPQILKRWGKGLKKFAFGGDDPNKQISKQTGKQSSKSESVAESLSIGFSESKNISNSQTLEKINNQAIFAEELLKLIQTRLKNGMGEGLWSTHVLFLAKNEATASTGCNILKGMWSGGQSHQDPLRTFNLTNLIAKSDSKIDSALQLISSISAKDHPLGTAYAGGYTWLTSGELALEANLPYYELPSLSSEPLVEYGRFLPSYNDNSRIELGLLVDRNIQTNSPVWMDTGRLNRHLFVTGLTGSGKSNTIRSILLELARQGIPFLIIEPAKAEYRLLNAELKERYNKGLSKFDHLEVFSLSGQGAEKLVLNPFAFEIKPGDDIATALLSHIDRLKAVFNSSLGMYSSMPYILEEMIYKAYIQAGWDIETGKNKYFEEARQYLKLPETSELRNLFLPTISELAGLVDVSMNSFFSGTSDYGTSLVGALKSRLNSFSRGAKGILLNQKLSIPTQTLLERPCVIELEAFADNDEKAFIMALLLSRIYEFRAGKLANGLKHVLVIEEAHRLLSKPNPTGEHSANARGKSVEVFSDMLAEIRAYGQGIIIADQIPAKLIPDVIKNTDIKIVHRLMAKEDREAVGTAMNLTEKQINDLSRATPGLATVSFDGLNSAIRVQITETKISPKNEETKTSFSQMERYKQNIFLSSEQLEFISSTEKSYWLIQRLFFIAILSSKKTDSLLSFMSKLKLCEAANKYTSIFKKDQIWPSIAEGSHILLQKLSNFCNPAESAILISSLISFGFPWSQETIFKNQLDEFCLLSIKKKKNLIKNFEPEIDFLSCVLTIFVNENNIREKISTILENTSQSNLSDEIELFLVELLKELTFNIETQLNRHNITRIFLPILNDISCTNENASNNKHYAIKFLGNKYLI